MGFTFIKSKEEVCRQRSADAANMKFDALIEASKKKTSTTHSAEHTSEYFTLLRKKSIFREKAFKYYMDNYEVASDKYVDEKKAASSSIKKFTNYLIDELSKL